MSTKVVEYFKNNDVKILIILALILVGFVCFRAGQSHQKSLQSSQLTVNINSTVAANPAQKNIKTLGDTLTRKGIDVKNIAQIEKQTTDSSTLPIQCALVGSKNSDKYHLPSCENAKKIKQDNIVCFPSEQDAQNNGYKAAKCCH